MTANPPSVRPTSRQPSWLTFAMLFLLWLAGSFWLLLWAIEPVLTFLGDTSTPAEQALSLSRVERGHLYSALLTLPGVALAVRARRPGWAAVFAATLILVGGAWAANGDLHPAEEPQGPGPGYCGEHSGGENTCPGG